jgi:mannose-6-phosphate isomerase-like protein (cupin superfamily)
VFQNPVPDIVKLLEIRTYGGMKMDLDAIKEQTNVNVYHIPKEKKVALHKHPKHDEVFYCFKGTGFGVLEDSEVPLIPGKAFIVPAETMHALRSDDNLYVTSFLIPVVTE